MPSAQGAQGSRLDSESDNDCPIWRALSCKSLHAFTACSPIEACQLCSSAGCIALYTDINQLCSFATHTRMEPQTRPRRPQARSASVPLPRNAGLHDAEKSQLLNLLLAHMITSNSNGTQPTASSSARPANSHAARS
jgi:hypothetical protein